MPLFGMYILNFYKIMIKVTLKQKLYGQKTKNIEFSQTFINLFWINYLEERTSRINAVKFHKKLLQFI